MSDRLSSVDNQSKGLLQTKEQDIDAFRKRVVELEKDSKGKDDRLSKLETQVVELSTQVADKDYEIEFYTHSIDELQNEVNSIKASGAKPTTSAKAEAPVVADSSADAEAWKKKCKMLQQNEVKYLEEIE